MKQRIYVAVACLVLSALILLLLPPAAPDAGPSATIGTGPNQNTQPGGSPSAPSHTDPDTPPVTSVPNADGVVRLYSCDPDTLRLYTQLAAEYTALTGQEVVVLSPEGADCQTALAQYMQSEDPPTVLCVHSQSQLLAWQDTLLDLSGTDLAAALCNDAFGLRCGGKLLGIPASVEGYGLLVNAQRLAVLYTRSDVSSLAMLSTVAKTLKDNNAITAFSSTDLTLQDAWYLLMGENLQNARGFIDLYFAYGDGCGQDMQSFVDGQSAFCLGGSWAYGTLETISDAALQPINQNLDILPTYAADAMQYLCDTAWCVNAGARQADMDAALAFLTWMVTAGENGTAPVDGLQALTVFRDAAWYGNQLENKLQSYMRTEGAVLQWKDVPLEAEALQSALQAYVQSHSDEDWQALCQIVTRIRADNGYDN